MAFRGTLNQTPTQPTTGEMFAEAFGNLGQTATEGILDYYQQKEQAAKDSKTRNLLSELTGMDPESFVGLTPDERRDLLKQGFQQRGQRDIEELKGQRPSKEEISIEEKSNNAKKALETVNKMREIRKKGNLGAYVKGGLHHFGGETARDKGIYEQLGKSLISYATSIPIRNRLEFETLAERLYDSSITDAEAEGVLDAMEKILNDSVSGSDEIVEEFVEETNAPSKSGKKKSTLKEIFG